MRLILLLILGLGAALALSIAFGETALTSAQYLDAVANPGSPAAQILFGIRAPRACCAAVAGAALGLAGAVMQGLLRNPLAEPGVLGVSAWSGSAAALAIVLGTWKPRRVHSRPAALGWRAGGGRGGSAAGGQVPRAGDADPVWRCAGCAGRGGDRADLQPLALADHPGRGSDLAAGLGRQPRLERSRLQAAAPTWRWGRRSAPMPARACACSRSATRPRRCPRPADGARLRVAAVTGAALLTGASVAMAGVIGFVGPGRAPHLVRGAVSDDPARTLAPSAIAGAILLTLADLLARVIPSETELRLGVVTALFGAPLFALVAWRAARSWRA